MSPFGYTPSSRTLAAQASSVGSAMKPRAWNTFSCRSRAPLPRTATEQYYHGASIPNGQLQPGDLVFFKNTYKHGISHVGIYAGAGKFIHAANAHKGVRMDNLGDSYYRSHYAGARRVLPAQMRLASSLP